VVYLQALGLLVLLGLFLAFLVGGGMVILGVGAAIGAVTIVVFGIVALVASVWDWLTTCFGRSRR
jgi:hypothetical protein